MSEDLLKDFEELLTRHKNKKSISVPAQEKPPAQPAAPAPANVAPPKKEKRKCTEKQLAALAAGRKKAAEKWLANGRSPEPQAAK
jgi:hypothetical protein